MNSVSSTECPACLHPFDADEKEHNTSGEPFPTHDVTGDGKLWCSVCEGECPWILWLKERFDTACDLGMVSDESERALRSAFDRAMFHRHGRILVA